MEEDRGLLRAVVGDGRPVVAVGALALIASGAFALFLSATGQFLPHDTAYLGLTPQQLCALHGCRIVHFMFHDRVSFGGVLIATGVMYLWLAEFPLRRRESWAWWALATSSAVGFLSFLAYLGYGYLDTWHGAATLALLPLYVAGLALTRDLRQVQVRAAPLDRRSPEGRGRVLLIASTVGIMAAGLTITAVGMTAVFVPQDLEFMGVTPQELRSINARLVPLIAHDRAGFGGALVSCGVAMFAAVLYGRPSRSLWEALGIAGVAGFATAIGVHPLIGYTSLTHLAPAIAGCVVFGTGLAMSVRGRGVP